VRKKSAFAATLRGVDVPPMPSTISSSTPKVETTSREKAPSKRRSAGVRGAPRDPDAYSAARAYQTTPFRPEAIIDSGSSASPTGRSR
jgi:hypothetical protein